MIWYNKWRKIMYKNDTRHALYHAVKNYLSKPYKGMKPIEHRISHGKRVVERRNHSALHAVRTASYIRVISDAVRIYGDESHRTIIKEIDYEKMIGQLEIAAVFNITGREGEESSASPKYRKYRESSAKYFVKYMLENPSVKKRLFANNEEMRKFAIDVIQNRGQVKEKTYNSLCSKILATAHDIDLSRCKDKKTMASIACTVDKMLSKQDIEKSVRKQIMKMADDAHSNTGEKSAVLGRKYDSKKVVELCYSLPGYKNSRVKFCESIPSKAEKAVMSKRPVFREKTPFESGKKIQRLLLEFIKKVGNVLGFGYLLIKEGSKVVGVAYSYIKKAIKVVGTVRSSIKEAIKSAVIGFAYIKKLSKAVGLPDKYTKKISTQSNF